MGVRHGLLGLAGLYLVGEHNLRSCLLKLIFQGSTTAQGIVTGWSYAGSVSLTSEAGLSSGWSRVGKQGDTDSGRVLSFGFEDLNDWNFLATTLESDLDTFDGEVCALDEVPGAFQSILIWNRDN